MSKIITDKLLPLDKTKEYTIKEMSAIKDMPYKNKLINGNFDIWQRGTSITGSAYCADRWASWDTGYTKTNSQQSFTGGQTDVPGSPKYYNRTVVTTAGTTAAQYLILGQHIEGVETFSNETVTISFWAKTSASQDISISFEQNFGTTGSPSTSVTTNITKITSTTSWTKYTTTTSISSINGKTLGTDGNDYLAIFFWFGAGSNWNTDTDTLGHQTGTFDIAQIQIEKGDTATPFEHRLSGKELTLCQRYYQSYGPTLTKNYAGASGANSYGCINYQFPVLMRADPSVTATYYSNFTLNNATAYIYAWGGMIYGQSTVVGSGSGASTAKFDAEL